MPLSLLEAMAAGIPAVASQVGAIPEIVHPGKTGRLVPPGDATLLGQALIEMLSDPESLQRQGVRARGEVGRSYSLRARVDIIEEGYRAAVSRRRGAAVAEQATR